MLVPVAEVLELRSSCTEILAQYQVLLLKIGRCHPFRIESAKFCSEGVNCSNVDLSLIKSLCAIFINGSRKLSEMPVFDCVSTLFI